MIFIPYFFSYLFLFSGSTQRSRWRYLQRNKFQRTEKSADLSLLLPRVVEPSGIGKETTRIKQRGFKSALTFRP
jgi:hypothetical protein